jgi:hypothetical protein
MHRGQLPEAHLAIDAHFCARAQPGQRTCEQAGTQRHVLVEGLVGRGVPGREVGRRQGAGAADRAVKDKQHYRPVAAVRRTAKSFPRIGRASGDQAPMMISPRHEESVPQISTRRSNGHGQEEC